MPPKAPRLPARQWRFRVRGALLPLCVWLTAASPTAATETIVAARYSQPTTRYAHGVLGDDIEFGALELTVRETPSPQGPQRSDAAPPESIVTVTLPKDRVFEDLTPRLVDVDQDGTAEAIVVESHNHTGAQLAIYDAKGHKIAATPHIGTRFRWLAPIGAADLDGDGHVEIAYIDRPHLAKTLRIWRYKERSLTEIATLPGLTNHRIGEDFISGGLRNCDNGAELILASADWSQIISITYQDGWQTTNLGPLHGRDDLTSALNC